MHANNMVKVKEDNKYGKSAAALKKVTRKSGSVNYIDAHLEALLDFVEESVIKIGLW